MFDKFSPRMGNSVFNCNFCGAECMQWMEVNPDKWVPFDLLNNEIHECTQKNIDALTRNDVIEHLQSMDFEVYVPRTSSWKYALISTNKANSIYFLIGKRGIDFKFYDEIRETKLDEKGKLFTDGGLLVRNYYHDSNVHVHELTLEIASRFVTDSPLDKSYFTSHGKTLQEQKAEYKRSMPKPIETAAKDEMVDLYSAISCGDGEDAYLGDGVWISSDGSWDDRGR